MGIRTRLALGHALVLLLVGGALAVGLPRVTDRAILAYTAGLLADQAAIVAAHPAAVRDLLADPSAGAAPFRYAVLVDARDQVRSAASANGRFTAGRAIGPALGALVNRARREERAIGRPVPGTDLVAAAAPLDAAGRAGWAVVLFRPVGELVPAIQRVQRIVLAVTLAGLALALVIAGALGGGLARRLARLGRAASGMAEGRLDLRVRDDVGDEVGSLAEAFNRMAERLQETIAGLRRSETLRRDLVASLAHDLRTPLTSIRGFAEALRDGLAQDPGQQRRYHRVIAYEAERLSRLVQDLFDYARLQAGQVEYRLQPLDVETWFRDFAEAARARAEAAGARLVMEAGPDRAGAAHARAQARAMVRADADRLAQAMGNLLDNAIRYNPVGEAVRLSFEPAAGSVRFTVRDRGPGVPEDERARIWERFYQGHQEEGRRGGGGLGLAIVRALVEGQGGRVGVGDAPGGGAEFWIELPKCSNSVHDSATV